jgi:hypothetical protein
MSQNNIVESYFKLLSQEHIDICHRQNEPHFFRMELEEVLMEIRSGVFFPFVALERAETKFNSQSTKRTSIGIMFMQIEQKTTPESINALYDFTDALADEFTRRIYEDVQTLKGPFTNIDWNSVSIQQIPFNNTTKIGGSRLVFDVIQNFKPVVTNSKWNR